MTEFKRELHYSLHQNEFVCLKCQRQFEQQYGYRLRNPLRVCGTKQLMRLWGWNNFKRHLQACWDRK